MTNINSTALNITRIAIGGTNASDFAETDNCLGSVATGASCSIKVTFTPAAAGSRTGSVTIQNNLPGIVQEVPLTGTGVTPLPIVSLSSTNIVFGNQPLGSTSAAQTVTLRNTGSATLNIQTVALAGANLVDFAIASATTCANGVSVAPNSSCVIQLTFTPKTLGTFSSTVGITDNAADSPETIGLSGATVQSPLISVTPSNISFPSQYVGTAGLPQTVTVTNSGNTPLGIASITASPADFGSLSSCGTSLAAGSSCSIGVFFDPTTGGTRTGTLTIRDNTPGSPQTVALSGVGQDFSVTPTSSQAATVTSGQTASYSLTISSKCGFNHSVTLACSGGPSQSTCAVSPNSVGLNGSSSATATVTVTTMAASLPPISPSARGGYRPLYLITELLGLSLLTGLLIWHRGRRPRLAYGLALLLLLCAGVTMSGCGGGVNRSSGSQGTPAGTFTLVVSGTFTSGSNTLTHSSNLTLVVQ